MNKTKVESGIKMANEIENENVNFWIAYGINMGIHCRSDLYDRRRYGASILSKYIMSLGFDNSEAGNVLTVYGLVVAIASWLSGVMVRFSVQDVLTFIFG